MTTPSYIPRLLMEPTTVTTVVEETSFEVESDSSGNYSFAANIALTTVSAYATNWLAIYDEWKLNQVQFKWHSRSSTASNGAMGMYIERDNTDAAGTTLAELYREQEAQEFRPYDDFVTSPKLTTLQWKPKDPSDYEYQATSTTSIFRLVVIGEGLPTSSKIGTVQIVARISFRGRP